MSDLSAINFEYEALWRAVDRDRGVSVESYYDYTPETSIHRIDPRFVSSGYYYKSQYASYLFSAFYPWTHCHVWQGGRISSFQHCDPTCISKEQILRRFRAINIKHLKRTPSLDEEEFHLEEIRLAFHAVLAPITQIIRDNFEAQYEPNVALIDGLVGYDGDATKFTDCVRDTALDFLRRTSPPRFLLDEYPKPRAP